MLRSSTSTVGRCARVRRSASGTRAGLGDDLQAVLVVDQQPEALADDGVVVGDDDGGLAAVGLLGAHGGSIPFAATRSHGRT